MRFQYTLDKLSYLIRPLNKANIDLFFNKNYVIYNKKVYIRAPYISFLKYYKPRYKSTLNIFVN